MIHGRLDSKQLSKLYLDQGLSTYAIAEQYKCDPKTIYFHLKRNGIPIREKRFIEIPEAKLRDMYLTKRESLARIGERHDCSASGILKKLIQYGIPRRSTSEMNVVHEKRNFAGSKCEQAYLTGFRLGDLGVRERGNLIYISTGTTKKAQAGLIKNLFCEYGPIWESRKNMETGAWNVSISLNKTFQFLVPKHQKIPAWIKRSNSYLFSFLAGYTDAEGNFQVAGGSARFRIRSYDRGILEDLCAFMKKCNIPYTYKLENKAGVNSQGIKRNKDCWCLAVNAKESLSRLLPKLLPLLRHEKRARDAHLALANVRRRMA